MGWSLSPSVYVDLLYSDRRSVAVCYRSPTVVAISGANGVLIIFSIVMAAGRNQIKVPSLLLLLPFICPAASPHRSLFSQSRMVLLRQFLLLPLLSFLLLPGFYLNMLVLIFILVSRHCRFACSCCGFAYVLRGNEFTQSLLANFCYDSGLLHLFPCGFFFIEATLSLFFSRFS